MCPHPIAITNAESGKLLVLDYQLEKEPVCSRLLEIRLHSPAEIKVLKNFPDARSLVYTEGVVFVCEFGKCIHCMGMNRPLKLSVSKI